MSQTLPPVEALPGLSRNEQTAVLDLLFEPAPAIHELLVPVVTTGTYSSYEALIDAAYDAFMGLTGASENASEARDKLHGILGSHPRLGAPKVESAQSAAEQAALQRGSEETAAELARLNREYEERFPGLRYVVFVNGRGREEIMENMKERISRADLQAEEKEGIQAMCAIAKDRAKKLLALTGFR